MHDDLRLRNLSELPISTRRFATAAANGSWRDLRLLIERTGSSLRPRHVFPIFFANLDPADIPSVDQLDLESPTYSPPCIPLIIISMQAMTRTRREILNNFPMTEMCADLWPRAWAWINFLHTYQEALPDLRRFPESDLYALYLSTILDLQADPGTAACPALLAQGVVKAVTIVLCSYSSPAATPIPGTKDLLRDCFSILESLGGFSEKRWVGVALDAGLLRAIVFCGVGGFKEIRVVVTTLVRDVLPPFLVSHSLLSALKPAMGQVQKFTTTSSFKASAIYTDWTRFSGLANERIALMQQYDRGLFAHLKLQACENSKCSRPGLRSEDEFKRCCGCLASVYCSQECQVADWNDGGHRDICEAIRAGLPYNRETLSTRDKSFLGALVNSEYQKVKYELLLQQIHFVRRSPGVQCSTLHFNYIEGHREIALIRDELFEHPDNPTKAQFIGHLSRAAKKEAGALVFVSVKIGPTPGVRYFLMRPFPSSLRVGLQRILDEVPVGSDLKSLLPTLLEKVKVLVEEPDEVLITL
ncbi:hypothetical protein DFH09DRAFT_1299924 [Mycena vulgaris]|nr:hypothetical protein DFH09DRAFT_1299924 [Mycena vulgaris]